jgi:hypothetical protein
MGKFQDTIKHRGWCCPWAFLRTYLNMPTDVMAALLKLTPRAIRYQRRAFRKGKLKCMECPNSACLIRREP